MMDGAAGTIRTPWDTPPAPGEAIEVAEGVLWLRLPLPMALDHVNVYALDEGDGWTIIDTGIWTEGCLAALQAALEGPLAGKPVRQVVLTHYHPDHAGLAGWLMETQGAPLAATRTSWLTTRMLQLDEETEATAASVAYWQAAGLSPEMLARKRAERPFNFKDMVWPIPTGYTRLKDGQRWRMGGRDWVIRTGDGHAPEHATFWSLDDNLVIGGDQLLPSISANIGVNASEPEANPLAEWLDSCARFVDYAREDQLILGGHKLPFTGLPLRLRQMSENHYGALARLRAHLATPRVAVECFPPLFKRAIDERVFGLALVETVAHLNYLLEDGQATRRKREDGAWLWERT